MDKDGTVIVKDSTNRFNTHLPAIFSEYLFVLLPLIIVVIITINKSNLRDIFYATDWSFAASVLMGQAVVRLVSGISSRKGNLYWQNVALIVSMIIVLGLVPSLIVLSLMLSAITPSFGLIVTQMFLFTLSSFVFITFGTIGQRYLSE